MADNTAGQVTYRFPKPVEGRYFRLVVTEPNASMYGSDKGEFCIAEFELYGINVGLSGESWEAEDPVIEDVEQELTEDPEVSEDDETEEDEEPAKKKKKKKVSYIITEGLEWWVWLLIAVGAVAVVGVVIFLVLFFKKKQTEPEA